MNLGPLEAMRVARLATDGFEEAVPLESKMVLDRGGAATFVISHVGRQSQRRGDKQCGTEVPSGHST